MPPDPAWQRIEAVPGLLALILRGLVPGARTGSRCADESRVNDAARQLARASQVCRAWYLAGVDELTWWALVERGPLAGTARWARREYGGVGVGGTTAGAGGTGGACSGGSAEIGSGCSWPAAFRAAAEQRRNWRAGSPSAARSYVTTVQGSQGVTSFDFDTACEHICTGDFASRLVVFRVGCAL